MRHASIVILSLLVGTVLAGYASAQGSYGSYAVPGDTVIVQGAELWSSASGDYGSYGSDRTTRRERVQARRQNRRNRNYGSYGSSQYEQSTYGSYGSTAHQPVRHVKQVRTMRRSRVMHSCPSCGASIEGPSPSLKPSEAIAWTPPAWMKQEDPTSMMLLASR